ncbi:MAG: hypothetical protein U0M91_01490 [Lachnospira eligens]|jgi:hypothetical protein
MRQLNDFTSPFELIDLEFPALSLSYYLNQIRPYGNIVYEYNPLRNYRLSSDTVINGELVEAGSIVDLDTDGFNFSLNNPLEIDAQSSYDGSVNLIFNDNRNIPRLVNSRFSVLQNNTYEVVDRIGNNDTNLYDSEQFDLDTSLYKRVNTIPTITFNSVLPSGNLKVGNYVIYIKYADADGNETDFVGESGIISCFIGGDRDPFSIDGGFRDQLASKSISLTVSDIDSSYDYIKVYYTRSTSDVDSNRVVTAHEIDRKFPVRNNSCNVIITGSEETKDIPVSDINIQYSIIDKAKSQTVCQNMLFLGNSCKPDMMYKDLSDISLRLLPYLIESDSERFIGKTSYDYSDLSDQSYSHEYYNTLNIYNKVGYWNEEIYRFGVVYIMKDGSLSPVYNIRGKNGIPKFEELQSAYLQSDLWKYENNEKVRNYIPIDESTFDVSGTSYLENAKGVLRINTDSDSRKVYGIGIAIPTEVSEYLNTLVQGLFIVRQKRIPTILAQAYVMPRDLEAEVPLINYGGSYIAERFLDNDRKLNESYLPRLYTISDMARVNRSAKVAICPEYDVRQSYFNHLFTGTEYVVRKADIQPSMTTLSRDIYNDRHYYVDNYYGRREEQFSRAKIIGVGDNVPIAAVEDYNFRGRAGEAEEGFRFRYIESKNKEKEATNLIRGAYSPYLGIIGDQVTIGSIINIYIPGYSEAQMSTYFNTRYEDNSPYYSVSSRLSLANIDSLLSLQKAGGDLYTYTVPCYRGDCYICNFTHRLNRNFQDPSAPTNDEVVDENTWKDNYDTENTENNAKINRGDVNAIQLGSWITFKVCSSYNLSIRSLDPSYPTEEGLTGLKRGFYPLQELSPAGATKIPESSVINGGYSSTTSEKQAFTLPDVPYIKNRFDTRIMYSDISVGDAFKNGFRVFQMTHYRDYPRTYGGIMKMIELFGNILCIFEHGIALIPVNERAVAGEGSGGNVFINTSNVLPENPKMLSDTYGTQWPESVIQTPYFVYGVDTVGKKIWRTNGDQFEIISDFKIQEFLNENITLSEREMTPIIGVRNVKGHYNAFKQDVMFTFYDDLYGFEEKVWNICYNEVMQKFITFYSWVPSYSANIDNIHFSFNRDTSKWISKLASSGSLSTSADGIVLSNVVIDDWETKDDMKLTKLGLVNRSLPNTQNTGLEIELTYEIVKDNFGMYKHFKIITEGEKQNKVSYLALKEDFEWTVPVVQLNLQCTIDYLYSSESAPQDLDDYVAGWKDYVTYNAGLYQSSIAITKQEVLDNGVNEGLNLTTDFWKHGQSGIIDIKDKIKPCYWYGKQHPFEYEFVVVDNPATHKIFENLQIVSNKAVPDSFHYEVVGESYEFHEDKKNMYIRQEATKDFYQYNGSDILYNRNFLDLRGKQRDILRNWKPTGQKVKSTMFPLYYARVDTFNEIEDYYKGKTAPNKDYVNLSGSEIVYNEKLDEFRVWTHAKAADIKDPRIGRLRGNMNYQGDVWNIQINPIIFVQRNEPAWNTAKLTKETIDKVPISVGNSPIPNDLKGFDITSETPVEDYMPQDLIDLGYGPEDIDTSDWWSGRKEARLRDKYIKIRVRYTGEELAIITALKTLYTISYA